MNSARRPWCYAARSRPMRSKPRARHAADLGYQVFVVADACRALTRPISEGGSGRLSTCGRWRWRVSKARLRPSSTSRQRSEPPRRPRRASAARREELDGASAIQLVPDVVSFAHGAIFSRAWVHFSAIGIALSLELRDAETRACGRRHAAGQDCSSGRLTEISDFGNKLSGSYSISCGSRVGVGKFVMAGLVPAIRSAATNLSCSDLRQFRG